ncbi:MAG TPA: aminopeptidase P family N-terminal domain-containing protein, partial [Burkholderiaceae bacterium]|nr:aminopeptidase P family N-terminal domain-containing protein [Burkholderiaceae bacterium]
MDTVVDSIGQVRARIDALRARMCAHGVSTWIALSSDPHLSEYLPAHWQSRQWLTGFSGSAGTLVLTEEFAGVWVDSRYWVEAQAQLAGTGIETVRASSALGTALFDWLAGNVANGSDVGVDGTCLGLSVARSLEAALQKRSARLRTDLDLPNEIWPSRPPLPDAPVVERRRALESLDRSEKLTKVREQMASIGAQWHWISSLDDIAWLLNLRGADVPYNPVFLAHVLIGPADVQLFIAPGKVAAPLRDTLRSDGVQIQDYSRAAAALGALAPGGALLLDPRRVTLAMAQSVPPGVRIIEQVNPTILLKSRKSESELANVRLTMEQDGAALCDFFVWLEQALARRERITELTIDEQLTAQRARRAGFVSLSFGTIAAFNANGAAPHYSATAASHAVICEATACGDGLLLIDSGGQYETGTTDITRVIAIGQVQAEQRRDFTLVLKAMIQLSRAQFP